jgi:hypothetical protein
MTRCSRVCRNGIILIGIALIAVAMPGCLPITWLPDSSGFVYTKFQRPTKPQESPWSMQLVHFDLKKNAPRVIADQVITNTMWPAVSPTGKHIAVARFRNRAKQTITAEILIYDFDGNVVQQSKQHPWPMPVDRDRPSDKPSADAHGSYLWWSPKGDVVVISDFINTGFFNVKSDNLTLIELARPIIHAGTPIRPDGSGCLLWLLSEIPTTGVAFVEWNGTKHKIDASALEELLMKKENRFGDGGIANLMMILPIQQLPSWWDGDRANAGSMRGHATYHIDTKRQAVLLHPKLQAAELIPDRTIIDIPGGVSVHLVKCLSGRAILNKTLEETFNKVVVVDRNTGKESLLFPRVAAEFMVLPSPDGKCVAISFYASTGFGRGPTDYHLVVINQKGELVTNLAFDDLKEQ